MTEYDVQSSAEYAADSNAGKVLTTTLWDQSGDIYVSINGKQTNLNVEYNKYCPIYSGTTRAVTGCTNTADAQIIYYWLEKGYADQITLVAESSDWFRVGDYSTSSTTVGKIEFGGASDEYSVPLVSELNDILANKDIVPLAGTGFSGNKTELGDFIAALNFYCGIKNHSDYWSSTSTWSYVAGAYYDGTNAEVYQASGFDSYYRIAFGGSAVDKKFYDTATDYFTEVGHSILRENLNYGEIIRIDIPGHSIYIDGWREGTNGYEYHLNYGWGVGNSSTRWYTESEIANITVTRITIDISPDTNVVVSNNESKYWGGSFLRGMERVNHIQTERLAANDDAVEFAFADDIAGKALSLSATAEITSMSDVEFKNINVDLYSESVSKLFLSSYALSFDFNDGSISVKGNNSDSIITQSGNKAVTLTLDDSFIYTGTYFSNVLEAADLLDYYSFSSLTDEFLGSVSGSIISAGSAADVVTLKGNSALLGDLKLGGGSNVLNVESGSIFYGNFSGSSLKVNLTINNAETDAMLVMTSSGERAFLTAAGSTLNVSVDTANLAAGGAYVLYSGSMFNQVNINLRFDNGGYKLFDINNSTIAHPDYTLVYDTDKEEIRLAYAVQPATISNITAEPEKALDGDGLTASDVIVTAKFSINTTKKYYSIDNGLNWQEYNDAGVRVVDNNTTVIFKAVNAANGETLSDPLTIDYIDKTPPPELAITSSNEKWTNGSVTLTAAFSNDEVAPDDFTEIKYSVDGKDYYTYTEATVVELTENGTVYFRAYDKRGNYSESSYTVTNIDKEAPVFPVDAILGSGSDWAQKVHVAIDETKITDNSSGVGTCYYSMDNGSTWNEYTSDVMFDNNGVVYFKVRDVAGNESDVVTYEITNVDNVAPGRPWVRADIYTKTNQSVTVTAKFDLSCGDVDKVEWSNNGVDWYSCGTVDPAESYFVYNLTADENGIFYFRSIDKVGNISETAYYAVTNIDKVAPEAPIVEVNTKSITNQPVILDALFDTFSGDVVSNQYSYTGNADDWHDYTESLVFYENGKVYFRSTDDVGNTSYSDYTVDNIDTTAPTAPVIKSDNDGRITDESIHVWGEFADREIERIEYTIDGVNWAVFDPEQAIVAGKGEEAITSVTLRAYDLAGNVSQEATVELKKGLAAELPEWAWSNEDAIQLQYSYDNYRWYDFTNDIEFTKNDGIYFRAIDEAGNISSSTYHEIKNIDDVADDRTMIRIYIDQNYTEDNTYGKRIDGVLLEYGENAFSSIDEAKKVYDFADPDVRDGIQVVAVNLKDEDLEKLGSIKLLSAIQVEPQGSKTGTVYAYKSKGVAEKSIVLVDRNYKNLTLEWFKNVSINDVVLDNVDGGNAEVRTSQRYSNGGRTLTRNTAHINSASGFFKAYNGSKVQDVSGYLNVEIKDSTIGSLAGGKKNNSEDLKTTDNGKKYTESVKESSSATGSVKLEKVTQSGNIENYKNVELQWVTITGLIENNKVDFSKSENYSEATKKFTRNISVKQTLASDGSLMINHSSVKGNIQGYNSVVLNSVQVDSVSRRADDGGSYRKQNDSWKISQDAKTGKVTGRLVESMTYTNGGTFSVTGESSVVGSVENFSKVTVGGGATVGDISNNAMLKDTKRYLYIWEDRELYGEQTLYNVNTENAKVALLESVEKHAANGSLTVTEKSKTGNISGFDKVTVSGKGSIGGITAVSIDNGKIICGSYEIKYKDAGKIKKDIAASGSVTETVITKAAAAVKVDGYTVNGNIAGYKSVTLNKTTVTGGIDLGAAYKTSYVESYKTVSGIVTRTYSESTAYTNNGTLKMTDSSVKGEIEGYANVVLDKSSTNAWDIVNNTAVKEEIKYNEKWDSLEWLRNPETVISLEQFMNQNPQQDGLLFSKLDQHRASGSITLKNGSTAGNISGFKTVKLEGKAHSDKEAALTVGCIQAYDGNCGAAKTEVKYKYADSEGRSYTETVKATMTTADSATVFGYDVNGSITGYKSVKLSDVNVNGNVDRGFDYVLTKTTVVDANGNKVIDTVQTFKQNGSFTAVDTEAGSVTNFNKVVLTNSVVGDISQSDVVKTVTREIYEGENRILNDVDTTCKLTGSVEITDSAAGNITNYKSVSVNNSEVGVLTNVSKVTVNGALSTMSGFTGTAENDSFTVGKDAVVWFSGVMDFAGGEKDKITVNGTLVWEDNVQLKGLEIIAGKGTIAANHELFTDVNNAFINNFEGKLLDLGNTCTGFRSEAFEAADNSIDTAFVWDGEDVFAGWLGSGEDVDCIDEVDYIKVTAEEKSTLIIASDAWGAGVTDTVTIGNKDYTITDGKVECELKAGGEYLIQINRKDDNSMSYTMTIA